MPSVDGGRSDREQQVALAGAGWSDQAQVLGSPHPFQTGQVVERGPWHRGGCQVELVECLADREARLSASGAGVRLIAGGDLGLHQGAEELLGVPPLGAGGEEQFGGEATHPGHLQPFQTGGQVRRQGRWSSAHGCSPPIR
jgi:hypothetical protein